MVRIELKKFEDGIAYLHCLPEGKDEEAFDISVDPEKREILTNTLGRRNSYVTHAAWKIYELYADNKTIPAVASSAWY